MRVQSNIDYDFLIEIVQRRSESDRTVIFSSFTIFDVLIKPPNFISTSAGRERTQKSNYIRPGNKSGGGRGKIHRTKREVPPRPSPR